MPLHIYGQLYVVIHPERAMAGGFGLRLARVHVGTGKPAVSMSAGSDNPSKARVFLAAARRRPILAGRATSALSIGGHPPQPIGTRRLPVANVEYEA
jgi:hypothetical protein